MIELTPWQVAHPLESLVAMSLAAGKLAEENQRLRANLAGRCSCDGDPIECSHEAARGEAEEQLRRLRVWAENAKKVADGWAADFHEMHHGLLVAFGECDRLECREAQRFLASFPDRPAGGTPAQETAP